MMPVGRNYTTAELHVNCIKALNPAVQRVRAEAKVIHCGRQLATAEARRAGSGRRELCTRMRRRLAWCSRRGRAK